MLFIDPHFVRLWEQYVTSTAGERAVGKSTTGTYGSHNAVFQPQNRQKQTLQNFILLGNRLFLFATTELSFCGVYHSLFQDEHNHFQHNTRGTKQFLLLQMRKSFSSFGVGACNDGLLFSMRGRGYEATHHHHHHHHWCVRF